MGNNMGDATVATRQAIRLSDYRPPAWHVEQVHLHFALDERATEVTARLKFRRNGETVLPLQLDGEQLELLAVRLDGRALGPDDYQLTAESLVLPSPPAQFELETVVRLDPSANTQLEGLYTSGGNFCTQCEAEGFRRITWFPDRPDVMAVYTVRLEADKTRYPVLLANGNPVEAGELEDGRHYAVWHDPFPKPSYLFALVAGDLACVEDRFTTASGREVALRIYVQHGNEDKCGHAMASLKKAMRWDEETYGREYDLDVYNIVAVDDFNMGAMENKGLNVFNSRYVLARPDTATDTDYINIEAVIAHEYFHNWSGNRVTCRDWFQLSLKEGFTVFRDAQFTAEMTAPAEKRIGDVVMLRSHQFREDAGPMAHPVRPDSYVEINNFYTLTVYEKGAEVVRMLHTLLGRDGFRQGTDLYFERHDGQAVTTDDFVAAMEEANGVDLSQFRRWYSQAGTPEVTARGRYDAATQRYTLTLTQRCPPTPGQPHKAPFHIPVAAGLLGADGGDLPLRLEGEPAAGGFERVLNLTAPEQSFTFVDVAEAPVPSLLRGFSAPVRLTVDLDDDALAFLMAHDSDPFNRWDAGQQLAVRVLRRLLGAERRSLDPRLAAAFRQTLQDPTPDRGLIARALTLPDEEYVAEFEAPVDPEAIHRARQFLRQALAAAQRDELTAVFEANSRNRPFRFTTECVGRRRLKNVCLDYLMAIGDDDIVNRCLAQFESADNMTDTLAALQLLAHSDRPERQGVLDAFYARWRHDPLVLDKWFTVQATSPQPDVLATVTALADHPDFTLKNPNRVRALIGAFCQRNHARFHDASGAGYRVLTEHVLALDRINPQVAARMCAPLSHWRRYEPGRRALMEQALQQIAGAPGLSRDVGEIVNKSLAAE